MKIDKDKMITTEILDLLKETFEQVEGYYLDRGTSLLETINAISVEAASLERSGDGETIAGHVYHCACHLGAIRSFIQ